MARKWPEGEVAPVFAEFSRRNPPFGSRQLWPTVQPVVWCMWRAAIAAGCEAYFSAGSTQSISWDDAITQRWTSSELQRKSRESVFLMKKHPPLNRCWEKKQLFRFVQRLQNTHSHIVALIKSKFPQRSDLEWRTLPGQCRSVTLPVWGLLCDQYLTCFSKHSLAERDGFGDGARSHAHPSNRYSPEGRELESFSK